MNFSKPFTVSKLVFKILKEIKKNKKNGLTEWKAALAGSDVEENKKSSRDTIYSYRKTITFNNYIKYIEIYKYQNTEKIRESNRVN